MEHQLFQSIVAVIGNVHKSRPSTKLRFSDDFIAKVHYWSVIHDRPVSWACEKRNWPIWQRRKKLPSTSTMSRRLRSKSVLALLAKIEEHVIAPKEPGLFWMIDGKPLPISGCSGDRQAGFGRAASCMAKGYKIHAIVGTDGSIAAWRVAPMNTDERVMALRLLRVASIQGYVAADSNYDSNELHRLCGTRDQLQLVTRRRFGAKRGMGHRQQTAGRLRSIALTENPNPAFADQMLHDRDEIERRFGQTTNWGGGLTCLPPWVRGHRRVHRWVQAKLVLRGLKTTPCTRSCAA